ncbi:MAG: efflux RND transporter periplasmic adaptor subunit [Spirochaetaceae bacterium]|nr:efflux RND transporter periplasmic adaptor subunit [Spirochaetaceae bacterium]
MADIRKIIQVENSAPLISKKKKKQAYLTLGILAAIVAGVIIVVLITSSQKVMVIGDYTIAKVVTGSLITSTEASGTVVLPTQVSIVSMEEGYASEIFVHEGDSIDQSTVLAILDVPNLEETRDDLINNLETEKMDLEEIVLTNEYTIKELETSLSRLTDDILEAGSDVDAEKELLSLKSSRLSEYETAVKTLGDLEEQRDDLLLNLEKETRKGELSIRKQKALISQLQVNLDRVEKDINDAHITSPIGGDILSLNEDLTVPGSLIEQNTNLFTVADTDDVYIDLEVYEQYSSYLEIGGKMELVISSNIVDAEITQIGRVASLSSDGLAATITVRAKPVGVTKLTPGASAVAEIPLGTKDDALLLPRGSYLTTGSQKYIYKIDGSWAYKTEVVFGEIQGSQVEVLSGLEIGDQVIISSYQNFIDQDVIEVK